MFYNRKRYFINDAARKGNIHLNVFSYYRSVVIKLNTCNLEEKKECGKDN